MLQSIASRRLNGARTTRGDASRKSKISLSAAARIVTVRFLGRVADVVSAALSPRDLSLPRFALRRDEAAASLAISETKFVQWCDDGRMPKGRKIDGVVLWDTQEIREAWDALKNGNLANNPFDRVVG